MGTHEASSRYESDRDSSSHQGLCGGSGLHHRMLHKTGHLLILSSTYVHAHLTDSLPTAHHTSLHSNHPTEHPVQLAAIYQMRNVIPPQLTDQSFLGFVLVDRALLSRLHGSDSQVRGRHYQPCNGHPTSLACISVE